MVRHPVIGLLAVIVFTAFVGQAAAAVLLYEPFNYTAGQGLAGTNGQNGSAGTAPPATPHGQVAPNGNSWMSTAYGSFNPYNQVNDAVTTATDLSYLNLHHPSATGSIQLGGNGTSPRLAFTPINNSADGSPVNAFYSFAFRIDDMSTTNAAGGLIAGFNNTRGSQSGNPSSVGASVFAMASGAGFVMGVLEQGIDGGQATYDTNELSFGTTYFVVGKYTINGTVNVGGAIPTTDDTAQIWINPTSLGGAEPAGALVAVNERTDLPTNAGDGNSTVQSFLLRQSGAVNTATNSAVTSMIIDELRIGHTYANVTPIPEPGSVALALVGLAAFAAARRRRRS